MLQVRDLRVSYGGINAVKSVSFEIQKGELVCLIGANGAGKTTTLKALCGVLPAAGEILFEEQSIRGIPAFQLARKGIVLVPEGRGIFKALTVEENLNMGAYTRRDKSAIRQDAEHAFNLFPRLLERRTQTAGTLSGGEQQMLAIARALMSRPKLLLLDEPSMGLAPILVQKIFETIKRISVEGVTILLIEQNAQRALEISHRGYVMESGLITLSDNSQALLVNDKVRHAYLGG